MALPNACCCGCNILALFISNSNSAKDDDFEIKLNGFTLGSINNDKNSCSGRIFRMKDNEPLWPEPGDAEPNCGNVLGVGGPTRFCDSGVCDFQPSLPISQGFLNVAPTPNLLEIVVVALHNNANFGKVNLFKLTQVDGNFELCQQIIRAEYSAPSPSPGELPKVIFSRSFLWSPGLP